MSVRIEWGETPRLIVVCYHFLQALKSRWNISSDRSFSILWLTSKWNWLLKKKKCRSMTWFNSLVIDWIEGDLNVSLQPFEWKGCWLNNWRSLAYVTKLIHYVTKMINWFKYLCYRNPFCVCASKNLAVIQLYYLIQVVIFLKNAPLSNFNLVSYMLFVANSEAISVIAFS